MGDHQASGNPISNPYTEARKWPISASPQFFIGEQAAFAPRAEPIEQVGDTCRVDLVDSDPENHESASLGENPVAELGRAAYRAPDPPAARAHRIRGGATQA